ncbi:GDSL esterase/lipase At1g29670-like [Cornus florida]|uniref:GDSL esterase/lipase At1g29670-like n=1 Tax=Cornus florida TaxID=4283 RepID=UPI00289C5C88|nr:GDSL esterase/lipase At1g29670-like [Cornus florida]
MASKASPNRLLLCFSFLAFLIACNCCCKEPEENHGAKVKGMFVFGSSLVDNGNNNFIQNILAKADYLPYGVDFPRGPSGRFTNGKNVIDLLGDHLKLPSYIPPFLDPSTKGNKIVNGVNYASGASGILDDTGSLAGNVISLNQQIREFEEVTLPDLEKQLGCNSRESLPHYLFVVGSGGNDYSLNYFLTRSASNVSLEVFTANLTNNLSLQLKKLYSLGARKFVLMSINPNGCSPMVRARQPEQKGCVEEQNEAALLYNAHLKSLVDLIKPQMPASNLVFVNTNKMIMDIIANPASKGFNDTNNACCDVDDVTGSLCRRGGSTCATRSTHLYFDGLHPTEAVNVQIAAKAYASTLTSEVYPINVKQLSLI